MSVDSATTATERATGVRLGDTAGRLPVFKAASDHSEWRRKLLHMAPGLIPFVLSAMEHQDPLEWFAVGVVIVICVVLTTVYLKSVARVRRADEHNFVATAISYPATIILSLLLFRSHTEFTSVVVCVLAFGDGCAYFAGKYLGKRKLPWNSHKTWLGTFAFVICSAPIAALAFWLEARNPAATWPLAFACAGAAAVCGAIAESWPTRVNDNLRVGLTALASVAVTYFATVSWLT